MYLDRDDTLARIGAATVVVIGVGAFFLALMLATAAPDIKRYLKLRSM